MSKSESYDGTSFSPSSSCLSCCPCLSCMICLALPMHPRILAQIHRRTTAPLRKLASLFLRGCPHRLVCTAVCLLLRSELLLQCVIPRFLQRLVSSRHFCPIWCSVNSSWEVMSKCLFTNEGLSFPHSDSQLRPDIFCAGFSITSAMKPKNLRVSAQNMIVLIYSELGTKYVLY